MSYTTTAVINDMNQREDATRFYKNLRERWTNHKFMPMSTKKVEQVKGQAK